jgi:hypothetical protein
MTASAATPDIASWPPLDDGKRTFGQQLLDWAADDSGARPRLCLVRGAAGSGKSLCSPGSWPGRPVIRSRPSTPPSRPRG